MTVIKKGLLFKEIKKQLRLKRYTPVLAIVQKLRKARGSKDLCYIIKNIIEFHEDHFTVEALEIEHEKVIRGRGTVGKINIVIITGSTILQYIKTIEKSHQCRYFKAKVLTDHTFAQINENI